MNLSLFGPPTEPAPAAPPLAAAAPRPSDVVRRLRHKAGPFLDVRCLTDAERGDSKTAHRALVTGEFDLIEILDGRFFREYADGHREPAPPAMNRTLVADALRYREFVEVEG